MQELIETLKSKIKIQMKRLKIQTPVIVVLMALSRNFGNFMNLILASKTQFHPRDLFCHHGNVQNNRFQEEIVSRVKIQLNIINFSDFTNFQNFNTKPSLKFYIFFNLEIWSMHVIYIVEQYL
jgi:hypothetical protein